jgi:CBS domain containing-hemolysin-like protein
MGAGYLEGGILYFTLSLFSLFASLSLTALSSSLQRLGRFQANTLIEARGILFFFQYLIGHFLKQQTWEGYFFSITFTRQLCQCAYAIFGTLFLVTIWADHLLSSLPFTWDFISVPFIILVIVGTLLLLDCSVRALGERDPVLCFSLCAAPASFFLAIAAPFSLPGFWLLKKHTLSPRYVEEGATTEKIRDKILEIIHESELAPHLDPQEQKLIASIALFKEQVAREIMMPRLKIFSLPEETTIAEAAHYFIKEGYSRIPIYRQTIDNIIGVLLYKDLLNIYVSSCSSLSSSIGILMKPVLYTPETKKISQLLQEFRNQQLHLAIVVDEYGSTAGIVTIEDILEELVGEIADEYDTGEKMLYSPLPEGGWSVDARMSVKEIERDLDIKIPSSPDYDTLGGYILHRGGMVPTQGWRIHHDTFDLEVLSADERSIHRVRVTPHFSEDLLQ